MIRLICAGKLKESFYISACAEYVKRISGFDRVEVCEVREVVERPDGLDKEADAIEKLIPGGAFACAMCIEGKLLSSEQLAQTVSDAKNRGFSSFVFIIGSSNGLSQRIKNRAQLRLSMSPMTFPHHLARVMVLEQIYRAECINAGIKYHK